MPSLRSKCKKGFCCNPPKSWHLINEVIFDLVQLCLLSTPRIFSLIFANLKNAIIPEIDWEVFKDGMNATPTFVSDFMQ